jgi:hypothetical protein
VTTTHPILSQFPSVHPAIHTTPATVVCYSVISVTSYHRRHGNTAVADGSFAGGRLGGAIAQSFHKYNFSCPIVGLRENAWLCCLSIQITHRTLTPIVVRFNCSWTCYKIPKLRSSHVTENYFSFLLPPALLQLALSWSYSLK